MLDRLFCSLPVACSIGADAKCSLEKNAPRGFMRAAGLIDMKEVPDPRQELIRHLGALRVMARALAGTGHEADDLVQDTIVKAWDKIDTFAPGSKMRGWLFTILRNTLYSEYRKAGREVSDEEGKLTAHLSEKPAHDGKLMLNNFYDAFRQLSLDQREVLLLVGAMGFSYDEAAQICGVTVGTVKSRVSRGRKLLIEKLKFEKPPFIVEADGITLAVTTVQSRIW